jgi:sec-independent protein translocase protein TatA
MGLSGTSVTQLLVILAIVLLVFGTKRVKSLGGDLGGAIRGFRRAMEGEDRGDAHSDDTSQQRRIEPVPEEKGGPEPTVRAH